MSIIYNQRIYDSGLNTWVYYSTIDSKTSSPLPAQTTPNHSGSLVAATHEVISESNVLGSDSGYVSQSEMWTRYETGQSVTIYDSAWDGSTLVLVGQGGLVLTTTDFIEWTTQTSGTGSTLYAAEWSGTEFWAVGDTGAVIRSADGVSWSTESTGLSSNLRGITFSGSLVLVNGYGGGVATRPLGGGAWTVQTSGTILDLRKSVWDGTNFIVSSVGYMSYSSNGVTWTHVALPSAFTGVIMRDVESDGSGTLIAVGNTGHIASSVDHGVTWSEEPSPTAEHLYGVSWTDTMWIIVGANGAAVSSSDAAIWTAQDTFSAETLRSATWNSNALITTGTNGTMIISSSGVEFLIDQNTGIYNPSDNVVGVMSGGVHAGSFVLRSGRTQLLLGDGHYTLPALGIGQEDNGLYAPNSGEVGVRVNGAWGASWVKAAVGGHGQLTLADGTVAEPSLSISGKGLYSNSASELGIAVQGSVAAIIRENAVAASGSEALWDLRGTVDQSGTAQYDVLKLSITENTTGSGASHFATFYRGGTLYASVDTAGRARAGDASAAAPSFSFVNNTTTGMYSDGTNVLAFAQAGSDVMQAVSQRSGASGDESLLVLSGDVGQSGTAGYTFLDVRATHTSIGSGAKWALKYSIGGTQQLGLGADGAFYALSYLFQGDTDTGISNPTADEIALATGGTNRMVLSNSATTISTAIGTINGTAAAPAIAPSSDTNTGMYFDGADGLYLATGGTWSATFDASGNLFIGGSMRTANGSAVSPSVVASSDTNTGIYFDGADGLYFATGGAERGNFTSTGLSVTGSLSLTGTLAGSSVSNVAAGNIAATDVQAAINELDGEKAGLALANIFAALNQFSAGIQVGAGSAATPAIASDGDSDTGFYFDDANGLYFATGGVKRAEIDASGQLVTQGNLISNASRNRSGDFIDCSITGNTTETSGVLTLTSIVNRSGFSVGSNLVTFPALGWYRVLGQCVATHTSTNDPTDISMLAELYSTTTRGAGTVVGQALTQRYSTSGGHWEKISMLTRPFEITNLTTQKLFLYFTSTYTGTITAQSTSVASHITIKRVQ